MYRSDKAIVVRLDIQQPGAVTETLGKLAAYYGGLLVPPTSPANGVAITEAQLAAWQTAPASSLVTAWSEATKAVDMIERHFGRLDRIAEPPAARGVEPSVLDRLQGFADRATAARQGTAMEQAVRSWKR